MLCVVTKENRAGYARELAAMHRDRKLVFIDRLGWNLHALKDGREIDQFDTDDAIYFIEAEDGRHRASMRLLPTTKPHLLSEVFPHLCAGPVPRGTDTFEATRLCITPEATKDEARRLRGIVWLGVLQYAFAHGVRRITGVTHVQFLQQVLASGLDVEPLGLPQMHEGALIGAHIVRITPDDERRQRDKLSDWGKSAERELAEVAE